MLRKIMIALLAVTSIGLLVPDVAAAAAPVVSVAER